MYWLRIYVVSRVLVCRALSLALREQEHFQGYVRPGFSVINEITLLSM
jgi:hypothetical protein